MRAIILAAGKPEYGSEPITNADIGGNRLLDIQISCLRTRGIEDIVLVAGYRHESIKRSDIDIRINSNWKADGSITSLESSIDLFNGSDDLLLLYGDIIYTPKIIDDIITANSSISALCFIDRSNIDLELSREFAMIEDGIITSITHSPDTSGLRTVFAGIVCIEKSKTQLVCDYIINICTDTSLHVGDLLDVMIKRGVDIRPIIVDKGWYELRTINNYNVTVTDSKFIKNVIHIHTDWTRRSFAYNQLDWVNDDSLLSSITSIAYENKSRIILDVGVGTGKVLMALKDTLVEGEFWGLDSSKAMLDKITGKEQFILHCDSAERMAKIPDNYFDLVTARMVFHHLEKPATVVKNIYRVLKENGILLICEGVPPSIRVIDWYTEMFRYKEDRKTITEIDLINYFIEGEFSDIRTRTIVMNGCSLHNWLDNAGLPEKNVSIIKKMHFEAPVYVKDDYAMEDTEGDCIMTWKFAITYGRKVRSTS